MKRIHSSNYNELAYRDGGGCLALFGLPFFLSGLAIMAGALSGTMKAKGGGPAPVIPLVLFSLVFTGVGTAFIFGRHGVIFDKMAKTITRWWGLLFIPLHSKRASIEKVTAVQITHERRKSKNSSYSVYPLRLMDNSREIMKISEPRDELEARRFAEEIAEFLECAVVNRTGGTPVVREAGTLQESLRDRAKRTGDEAIIAAPPPNMRAVFSAHGNSVTFEVPPPPFQIVLLFPLIGAMIFAGIVSFMFLIPMLSDKTMTGDARWIFGGFIGTFFIGLPILGALGGIVKNLVSRSTIQAEPETLSVRRKGLIFNRTESLPAFEIEELRLDQSARTGIASGPCIAAVTDKKVMRFGEGLDRAELEWMRNVILKALTT